MALHKNLYSVLCAAGLFAVVNSASISNVEPHIIGGVQVSIEQYPFQAALVCYGDHHCGASILGPNYIVTAAHCLAPLESLDACRVAVGSVSKYDKETLIELYSVYRHPNYKTGKLEFDVATAKLANVVTFGAKVQPIALVPINKEPQPGDMVTASGWGSISHSGDQSEFLQAATLPIVKRGDCRRADEVNITNNMICAGGFGKSIFRGDSGGPLINAKKELVGIVSFTNTVKALVVPGVFTNIASPPVHQFITKYFPETKNKGNP